MTRADTAESFHKQGFNCAQSVLCACGDMTGLEEKTALGLTGGLGGGLRAGEVCGAVSGAVIALSAVFPYNDSADQLAKDRIARLAAEMCARFREKYGTLACRDLLARTEHEADQHMFCDDYIRFCTEEAEKIIAGER